MKAVLTPEGKCSVNDGRTRGRHRRTRIDDIKVHATSAVRELHWLRIPQRIEYKLCLVVHKTFIGQWPDYISDLLTPVADIPTRSSLRASSSSNLFLPRTERRFGDRAFSIAASRAWNRLATELKLMRSSTTTFKRHLKTFLFNSAYTSHWP